MLFGTLSDDVICEEPIIGMFGNHVCISIVHYYNGHHHDHHHHDHHRHHQNNQDHPSIAHLLLIVAASTPSCKSHTHNLCLLVVTIIDSGKRNTQKLAKEILRNKKNKYLWQNYSLLEQTIDILIKS